jgi:hypothetical protein
MDKGQYSCIWIQFELSSQNAVTQNFNFTYFGHERWYQHYWRWHGLRIRRLESSLEAHQPLIDAIFDRFQCSSISIWRVRRISIVRSTWAHCRKSHWQRRGKGFIRDISFDPDTHSLHFVYLAGRDSMQDQRGGGVTRYASAKMPIVVQTWRWFAPGTFSYSVHWNV